MVPLPVVEYNQYSFDQCRLEGLQRVRGEARNRALAPSTEAMVMVEARRSLSPEEGRRWEQLEADGANYWVGWGPRFMPHGYLD